MDSEMLIYRLILNTFIAVLSHQFILTYTTVAFIGEACLTSLDHRTRVTWTRILITETRHKIQLQDVLTIIYFYILMSTLEESKDQRESTIRWNLNDHLILTLLF